MPKNRIDSYSFPCVFCFRYKYYVRKLVFTCYERWKRVQIFFLETICITHVRTNEKKSRNLPRDFNIALSVLLYNNSAAPNKSSYLATNSLVDLL